MHVYSSKLQLQLKEFITKASEALAYLDADRLEEMAQSCCEFNKDSSLSTESLQAAIPELTVFSNILEVTRANLGVVHSASGRKSEQLEYKKGSLSKALCHSKTPKTRSSNGDN